MSYELALTPEAGDDLVNLIDSLPARSRRDAIDAVDAELQKLAVNPQLATKSVLSRPTYRFGFTVDRVSYHWAATFKYSQDERVIVVTQLYRVPL